MAGNRKIINNRRNLSCVILCAGLLVGCGGFDGGKLETPYSFEDGNSWISSGLLSEGEKADSFAKNLCVVMDESAYADSKVTAEAASVFGISDGDVIFSKNSFERMNPASTTKIMTALLAIKYGNLSDEVTVTDAAVITEKGATLCDIKPGDVLTMEQLLYGLMLPSGNDAGAAIAVHMAGSEEAFADLMNQEAKALGATGTHFVNPHGLTDEEHYTTAYDLYLIFNEALKDQTFRDVAGATVYNAVYKDAKGNTVTKTWKGGNWYMVGERQAPEPLTVFGGKTGTTSAAGYCLVMGSRNPEGKEYISVVLKAGSRSGLYENMTNIIRKIVE